jgi:hypothetical protein
MVSCSDGTLYTGITNNLEKRIDAHNSGKDGARYTRSRRPVKLVYSENIGSSRFTNYILDCSENLTMHAELYRQRIRELQEDRAFIAEEIKEFYRQNDLNVIIHFLQSMENSKATGSMQSGMEVGLAEGLEQKLQLSPPQPIEQTMTILPPLQPPAGIKRALKKLAKQAYKIQPPEMLALFARKDTDCDRDQSADLAF